MTPGPMTPETPDAARPRHGRTPAVDLFRLVSIVLVAVGHWLAASIYYEHGQFHTEDVLGISWVGWVVLGFQVIPVFFLVGGYANAASWSATARPNWDEWLRHRVVRLTVPTSVYILVGCAAAMVARAAGVDPGTLGLAGWAVALHLWFLPTYLLVAALTPVFYAAHRRWGLWVPAVMAAAAVLVDLAVLDWHLAIVGWANYLLVWGVAHQLGIAWQDGTFARLRWLSAALFLIGASGWAAAVWLGGFPVLLVGTGTGFTGQRLSNTSPPSVALLGFALAQSALVVAVSGPVDRWLSRRGWQPALARSGRGVMLAYLWHMAPVIPAAIALDVTGWMPRLPVASLPWIGLRFAWAAIVGVLLIVLIAVLGWLRPFARRLLVVQPHGKTLTQRRWSWPLLGAGALAVGWALYLFAVNGFAPSGSIPGAALSAYGVGAVLLAAGTWLAPRPASAWAVLSRPV